MNGYTNRPTEPLDVLIRDQAMAYDVPSRPKPSEWDDPDVSPTRRYCPRCRTWGGHDPRGDC